MQIKIIRLNHKAVPPTYATPGAAAIDLHACLDDTVRVREGHASVLIPTGFTIEIPEGWAGLIFPRSGLGHKNGLVLGNGTGVIDSDYRGEIFVSVVKRPHSGLDVAINHGDRIAQMIFVPAPRVELVGSYIVSETERGAGGFGHTGL